VQNSVEEFSSPQQKMGDKWQTAVTQRKVWELKQIRSRM